MAQMVEASVQKLTVQQLLTTRNESEFRGGVKLLTAQERANLRKDLDAGVSSRNFLERQSAQRKLGILDHEEAEESSNRAFVRKQLEAEQIRHDCLHHRL